VELYEYWRLAVRQLPILVLTLVIGFSGAVYVNYITIPTYSASADVFVTTPSVTLDVGSLATGSNFSEQRVVSYAKIISGPATLGPVIEKLGLDMTTEELANDVHATAPNGTVLISISVDSLDPNKAAAIANAVAAQFEYTVQQLELTSAATATNIKVTPVRQAKPNYNPSSPKKSLNLALGLILGLALGAGIILLRVFFDRTVKNEDHIGETHLVGTIRFDPTARDKPLLTELSKYSARAEEFRQIRTNLRLTEGNSTIRTLAVTSALPNEGKTTTSLNLALSLSDAGQKVAMIDCDLRRPQLNLFLELPKNLPGVADIIQSAALLRTYLAHPEKMMQKINPNFFVLTSGEITSDSAELVGSAGFKQLIYGLRKQFDVVILDCPPVLPIADAADTAKIVDGVLLVVKAGKTSIKQFQGSIASLQNVDAHIIGCVINMIPTNRNAEEYGYRYGYGGYRNYYGYKGRNKDKSLYSPLEPYGPGVATTTQSPRIDESNEVRDISDLHELSFELKESHGMIKRNISRASAIIYQRLTNELHEHTSAKYMGQENNYTAGNSKPAWRNGLDAYFTGIIHLQKIAKAKKGFFKLLATKTKIESEEQKTQKYVDDFMKSLEQERNREVKLPTTKKSAKKVSQKSKSYVKKKSTPIKIYAKKSTAKKLPRN